MSRLSWRREGLSHGAEKDFSWRREGLSHGAENDFSWRREGLSRTHHTSETARAAMLTGVSVMPAIAILASTFIQKYLPLHLYADCRQEQHPNSGVCAGLRLLLLLLLYTCNSICVSQTLVPNGQPMLIRIFRDRPRITAHNFFCLSYRRHWCLTVSEC